MELKKYRIYVNSGYLVQKDESSMFKLAKELMAIGINVDLRVELISEDKNGKNIN